MQRFRTIRKLLNLIGNAAKAIEISEIAFAFVFQFSCDELKAISKVNIPGIKVKRQDTSPSYSLGESGN